MLGFLFLYKNIFYSNPMIKNNYSSLFIKLQNITGLNTWIDNRYNTKSIQALFGQETQGIIIYRSMKRSVNFN